MAQSIAIEKDQATRWNLHGSRYDLHRLPARVQLVLEPARGLIDDSKQQRVAPARVVGGVIMPADVIPCLRVEVESVRVRVSGG